MTLFKSWRTRIALVLAVVGPGFITANVDNDAGGIATYSVAGAQFGYSLLWTMIPITIALVITNFGNVVSEFAGVASSFELFGVSKYIVVPVAALAVWALVVHGTYASVEKIFLSASAFYVAY